MYSCTCCIRNCTKADISQHKKDTSPAELSNLSKLSFFAFDPLLALCPPACQRWTDWGLVHTTPQEFEHGGFTPKTHRTFAVHATLEEFKNTTITGYFGFVFEENSVREITWLLRRHRFRKAPFSKCFPFTRKRNAGVFKFLRLKRRFRKAPLVRTVGRTVVSNFSGVWTFPEPPGSCRPKPTEISSKRIFDRLNSWRIPTLTDWNENTRLVC